MGKTKTPKEFKIHVDQSCLTDSTDLGMAAERTASNETVVRHDSWSTDLHTEETPIDEHKDEMDEKEHEARERQIDRIEAQIQAAARAVVASIEQDAYGGNEESVLSMQTDESYDRDGTELTYDGTELSYDNGTEATYESEDDNHPQKETDLSASELSYESESELQSEVNKDNETTNIEQEDHTDAIEPEVAEEDNTKDEMEEPEAEKVAEQEEITDNKSVLDIQEDEDNTKEANQNEEVEPESEVEVAEAAKPEAESQQELEAEAEPELEPEAELEPVFESEIESQSENDRAGDSSSQHDGDIDDDVFSSNSSRSNRSSLNSCDDLHHSDGPYSDKALTSPTVGEEAATKHEDQVISRVPSAASYMHPIPDSGQQTPSKVLHRPPFRSPSSVRAMQMSSPTPSIFSSPRSMKRHVPTVSRIGTPNSYSSKTRTPTRLKPRKADPLVLLHVTVMPLQWNYSHLISSPDLPASLQNVKENWRLLQEKLGDTVLERGILLPHPQDSYEVLEERLLEALELPVRPRALILKCGHYMGPTDAEASSEDEDAFDAWKEGAPERKWCDICRRDVRLEYTGEEEGRKRFAVKIYASNGLMRAGAWAACWKEMERVDVEIGPYIEPNQHDELEAFLLTKPVVISQSIHEEAEDDGFEDEDTVEHVHIHEEPEEPSNEEQPPTDEGQNHERTLGDEEPLIQQQPQSEQSQEISDLEKELADHIEAEAAQNQRVMMEETHEVQFAQNQQAMVEEIRDEHFDRRDRRRSIDEYDLRKIMDHERLRGRFERDTQSAQPSRPSTRNSFRPQQQVNDESLSELLLAAAKVAMRDRRNVAIIALSLLVLILALRPSTPVPQNETKYSGASSAVSKIATESLQPATSIVWQTMTTTMEVVPGVPTKAAEVVIEKPRQVAADRAASSLRVAKPASKKTTKLAPKKAKKVPAKVVEVVQERVPEPVVEEELPVEEVEPVEQILDAQTRVENEEVETLDETDEIQIDTIGEESDDVDVDIGSPVEEIVASTNLVTEEAPEATVISEEPEVAEEPIEEIEEQEERPADEL